MSLVEFFHYFTWADVLHDPDVGSLSAEDEEMLRK